MPRRARIRIPGVPWHVTQRGHDGEPCFETVADRAFYEHHLARLSNEHECPVHAYVLMTNHVHILLTPPKPYSISALMKRLAQIATQRFNANHGRSGSLWEGRFQSSIVESERYFFACHRYIENNPVRAGMVSHPGDYRWSSYRTNADGWNSTLVVPHEEYLRLGADAAERQDAYRNLFGAGTDDDDAFIRERTRGGFAIGRKAYCDRFGKSAAPRRAQRGRKR